ncbi:hypothetical protein GRR92_14380 [Lactococcus lactis subsp. lactis]|uniref:hypothetical protein n=1 Tax=Lactococcus lactis TaxID=1358 RepID=UPI000D59869F|nr:hypothetical protein [Lactococcus lactis]AWJ95573.1 hypothetical protein P620_14185 [Lactococcus lactis subsp. lactis KLDS 4.0325]MBR8675494.1 hypothetical protein [Lactococcus lactis subsp. lactis]MBR8678260.1 hypothetical protein [Lactococcus lactis subsp. lactis]MBR8685743.1 hypothetical protein [Lactococcus lactis subsp. lactis]RXS49939.1 hypothetical protein ES032_13855 [Lactococcus lactis]
MKKKYKMLAVSLIGLLSFEVVAPSFASNRNYGIEQLSKLTTKVKADDLNIEVPESLQDMALDSNQEIDIQNMNTQELKSFEQIVQEEAEKAELPTTEDTEVYKQTLLDLYDSNSAIYQDVSSATEQVIEEINENHDSLLDKITGEKVIAASHGTVSVKMLASTLNVAVNLACGGVGGAAVKTLVKKYGAKRAEQILSRVLRDKLLKLGYKKGAAIGGVVGKIVNNFLDPGTAVAKYIDSQDKIRNNGWIELW